LDPEKWLFFIETDDSLSKEVVERILSNEQYDVWEPGELIKIDKGWAVGLKPIHRSEPSWMMALR